MDLYDNEVSIDKIKQEFLYDNEYDDFDYEIYLTSLALAFWEIGLMNDTLLKKVNDTIAKGVGVKVWTEECDLTFKLSDGQYRAVICTKITQQRGQCTYDLVGTTYIRKLKPDAKVIEDYAVCGRWISSGFDKNEMLEMQPDIVKLWNKKPNTSNRFLGLSYHW